MNFLSHTEAVENPCKEVLTYPWQCFQEMFLATPAAVGTFFVSIGGFVIAVIIWGFIFALALYAILFPLKHLYRATRYFFTETKVGQKLASFIPMQKCLGKAQEVQEVQEVQPSKKFLNTQAIGDIGANIVSKVHVNSKWFKSALKHVQLGKTNELPDQSTDQSIDQSIVQSESIESPSKTPQRSTSRISALTPKILSSRVHKE